MIIILLIYLLMRVRSVSAIKNDSGKFEEDLGKMRAIKANSIKMLLVNTYSPEQKLSHTNQISITQQPHTQVGT